MVHLRSVRLGKSGSGFPFTVPTIQSLGELTLDTPVTFFVGENGSGKSTLLEGIALAAGLPTVGSGESKSDDTLAAQRKLSKALKLTWNKRAMRGFFLRAEDFFGFTKRLSQMRSDMREELARIDRDLAGSSDYARGLAKMPASRELADMQARYGEDLDANSHGQSFLKLFQSRFIPGGLYLLDEPEAPLSPQSQLGLMAMMSDMVEQEAQFIVATHSPIVLAFPGARILSFDAGAVRPADYDSLEHVALTRDFLNAPERFLRHLKNGD